MAQFGEGAFQGGEQVAFGAALEHLGDKRAARREHRLGEGESVLGKGDDAQMVRRVAFDLKRMFPTFRDVAIEAGWGGPINVSGLNLPFFGTTGHGNVHHGLGYTGNGVGPSHLGGKILAALATHADDDLTRLAIVNREPKRFPPEPIRSPGMLIANEAIRRKDDLEDAGRWVSPLTRAFAGLPRKLGFNLGPTTW